MAEKKTYARSTFMAERRACDHFRQRAEELAQANKALEAVLLQVAKLAAPKPLFYNPLNVYTAEQWRDHALRKAGIETPWSKAEAAK